MGPKGRGVSNFPIDGFVKKCLIAVIETQVVWATSGQGPTGRCATTGSIQERGNEQGISGNGEDHAGRYR